VRRHSILSTPSSYVISHNSTASLRRVASCLQSPSRWAPAQSASKSLVRRQTTRQGMPHGSIWRLRLASGVSGSNIVCTGVHSHLRHPSGLWFGQRFHEVQDPDGHRRHRVSLAWTLRLRLYDALADADAGLNLICTRFLWCRIISLVGLSAKTKSGTFGTGCELVRISGGDVTFLCAG
jgi:hypothetical protein